MDVKELAKLLDINKEKLDVIDRITKHHPGYGTDLGWSWYVGGMVDSGDWDIKRLLQIPLNNLIVQLEIWDKADADSKKRSEETHAEIERHRQAGTLADYDKMIKEKHEHEMREWKEKHERFLMWGK